MTHLWLTIFNFLSLVWIHEAAKTMGPVGNIIINSVSACEDKTLTDDIIIEAEIKSIDAKGKKELFGRLKNKIPIDETIDLSVDVYKWEAGGWKRFFGYQGKFCKEVEKIISKLYEKIRNASQPPIKQSCPIPPGDYKWENFQAVTKDFPIPTIFYGRLSVKLTLKKKGKLLTCVKGEGDSQAPM